MRIARNAAFKKFNSILYVVANFIAIPMVHFAKPGKLDFTLQGRYTGDVF